MMRNNLAQIAWAVLIVSFVLFCALVVGAPLAVRSYLVNATTDAHAYVESISGTVLVQGPDDPEPIGVSLSGQAGQSGARTREVKAGTSFATDDVSRAMITFLYGTNAEEEAVLSSVQLYNNTRVTAQEHRAPRFRISSNTNRLVLDIVSGQMRIAVTHANAHAGDEVPYVEVVTPHSRVSLQEGSYSVRVTNEMSETSVRFGTATVMAAHQYVTLAGGQRTEVYLGQPPDTPLPAAQNLIVNGNFAKPLAPSWEVYTFVASTDVISGEAEIVTTGGRKAVFFSRMGEDGIHTEVAISQVINRDVLDFESLVLRLDVKLMYQSLSGGGYLSSEFPIMVRIDYKDAYGIDRFWTHGFYYQNVDNHPIHQDVWGKPLGEGIPHAVWYPYESGNLKADLGDIRPARIHSIRIYASGWNYQSMVAEVGLIAE